MQQPNPMAPLVADLYQQASPPQRARLLNLMLRQLGPLALVTVAAGAFAALLHERRWRQAEVTVEETRRVGAAQVLALAVYVEQKAPEVLSSVTSPHG